MPTPRAFTTARTRTRRTGPGSAQARSTSTPTTATRSRARQPQRRAVGVQGAEQGLDSPHHRKLPDGLGRICAQELRRGPGGLLAQRDLPIRGRHRLREPVRLGAQPVGDSQLRRLLRSGSFRPINIGGIRSSLNYNRLRYVSAVTDPLERAGLRHGVVGREYDEQPLHRDGLQERAGGASLVEDPRLRLREPRAFSWIRTGCAGCSPAATTASCAG
jgi:hypothetical protein